MPLIVAALIVAVSGAATDLHDTFGLAGAIGIAIVIPLGMYLISIPFGVDAVGQGDLILLVSVGLFEGLVRTITGIVVGAFLGGRGHRVLLATKRVTRKTFIPYGPFLIIGAFWGSSSASDERTVGGDRPDRGPPYRTDVRPASVTVVACRRT